MSEPQPYQFLRDIIEEHEPEGWAIEFGVHSGRSLAMIAEYMPVIGLDSFDGLPEDWRKDYLKGEFAYEPGQPLPHTTNAMILRGWFNDTLPVLVERGLPPLGLVHIDCDIYSSTVTALEGVAHAIQPGTIISFDEMQGYPGWQQHEYRAWMEFAEKHEVVHTVLAVADQQWAARVEEIS